MSDWINLPENISDYMGIIYLIRNNHPDITKKYYIGIKQILKRTILKKNKTRKRNKIVWKDNGLEDYWGSSVKLLEDIEKYGKEYFTREVIELCNSKFHMKYGEIEWQIKCKVLFDERFYNQIVNARLSKIPKNYVDIERNPDNLNLT
jgi:hypothetical protein